MNYLRGGIFSRCGYMPTKLCGRTFSSIGRFFMQRLRGGYLLGVIGVDGLLLMFRGDLRRIGRGDVVRELRTYVIGIAGHVGFKGNGGTDG